MRFPKSGKIAINELNNHQTLHNLENIYCGLAESIVKLKLNSKAILLLISIYPFII